MNLRTQWERPLLVASGNRVHELTFAYGRLFSTCDRVTQVLVLFPRASSRSISTPSRGRCARCGGRIWAGSSRRKRTRPGVTCSPSSWRTYSLASGRLCSNNSNNSNSNHRRRRSNSSSNSRNSISSCCRSSNSNNSGRAG